MATNKDLLSKGVKRMFMALPLMFIGPALYYNALMNKHTNWHYLVLIISVLICIFSVYTAFKGLQLITKALFDDN
jgi:hypothetical protein